VNDLPRELISTSFQDIPNEVLKHVLSPLLSLILNDITARRSVLIQARTLKPIFMFYSLQEIVFKVTFEMPYDKYYNPLLYS
jgi:hypothetical protein